MVNVAAHQCSQHTLGSTLTCMDALLAATPSRRVKRSHLLHILLQTSFANVVCHALVFAFVTAWSCRAWLVQALTATDAEILRSSGLDAMVRHSPAEYRAWQEGA